MITKTNKAFPKERLYFNFSEFSQVQPSQKLNAVSGHKKNLSAQRDFWCTRVDELLNSIVDETIDINRWKNEG